MIQRRARAVLSVLVIAACGGGGETAGKPAAPVKSAIAGCANDNECAVSAGACCRCCDEPPSPALKHDVDQCASTDCSFTGCNLASCATVDPMTDYRAVCASNRCTIEHR